MSQHNLTSDELELLEKGLSSETKTVNIRLREGEYQFDLAKAIASFELELRFPNVKDLIKKLYEEKTEDIRFVRKIQTILKKMEKSSVIQILPKKKPWGLQRYALRSFRFQDVEKNLVIFAAESEVKRTRDLLRSLPSRRQTFTLKPTHIKTRILPLTLFAIVVLSYIIILWTLTQPIGNPTIFIIAFSIAAICSILLGVSLSKK